MLQTFSAQPSSILGKRKQADYVLHLTSGSEHESTDSEATPKSNLILVNGKLVSRESKKIYHCTVQGCTKAYSKPSRLQEHQRSHTGERPFVCTTCQKSYIRESHLQAHSRTHFPASARPLACSEPECTKRFWTSQHLKVHRDWHRGTKSFTCDQPECHEAFAKHTQLKAHIASSHSPPGTKLFQCSHSGCTKSFSTNQHLRAHVKTHDQKRYTCSQPDCLPQIDSEPIYFSNWTSLQHHIRVVHPPSCSHPNCSGKVFSSRDNLRTHIKLHEQQTAEASLHSLVYASDNEVKPAAKRRRGGDFGRDWHCAFEDCSKDFKSKKALTTHVNVTHLGRRDHVCPREGCESNFGYKHLLQRHLVKMHPSSSDDERESSDDEIEGTYPVSKADFSIANLTGAAYASNAIERTNSGKALHCPYPNLDGLTDEGQPQFAGQSCGYVFSRAYDFRRHLRASHQVIVSKEAAEAWTNGKKKII